MYKLICFGSFFFIFSFILLFCVDIDECVSGDYQCFGGIVICMNIVGLYSFCKNGYVGDGMISCVLIGEWYLVKIVVFWKIEKKFGEGKLLGRWFLYQLCNFGRVCDD